MIKYIFSNIINFVNKYKYLKNIKKRFPLATIHPDTIIDENVNLAFGVNINSKVIVKGPVNIGKGTFINGPSKLVSGKENFILIGSFCSIAEFTYIITANHVLNTPSTYQTANGPFKYLAKVKGKSGNIIIGSDVWIGTHSVILQNVTIGDGAVIGAGSIVTKNVPPYAIVAGAPAKVIKYRFEKDIINWLSLIKWWDWSNELLKKNNWFFEVDLANISLKDFEEIKKRVKESMNLNTNG